MAPRVHQVPPGYRALEVPLDTTRRREEAVQEYKVLPVPQVSREGLDPAISHFVSTNSKRKLHRLLGYQLRQELLYEKMNIR